MSNRHEFKHSTSITSCDYNDEKGEMIICFVSGGTYHYECPKSVYNDLCAAPSPGKHFHVYIKPYYKGVK